MAVVIAAVVAMPLVAVACSSDDDTSSSSNSEASSTTQATAPAQNPGQPVERFNDPTDPIEVPVGQVFEITLQADAGECFSWDFTTTDTGVVTLTTSRPSAIATQDDPPLTGASDLDVFEFTADEAGTVDLAFQEISPCEPGTTRDTRTFTVVVTAR
jgi:predicted secreted protein